MTDRKFLAVVVFTYKHPDTVYAILTQWMALLKELEFDLYYLDSSPDTSTKEIVESFQKRCSRLYYIRISPECDSEKKTRLPFNKDFLPYKYKYFWPIKDRVVPTPGLMLKTYMCLINGCDAVEISPKHPNDCFAPLKYKSEYTDCVEFYKDLAWSAIDMQSTIYSYDTVLSHYDEKMIIERYPEPGFNHTMAFFHYLAEMRSCRIYFIYAGTKNCTFLSDNVISGWRMNNTGIYLFGYSWPKTNKALPEVYKPYMKKAVKEETNLPALFGSIDGLLSLNFSDEVNSQYVKQMLTKWNNYSDIPISVARMIFEKDYNSVYLWFIDTLSGYLSEDKTEKAALLFAGTRMFIGNTSFYKNNKQLMDDLLSIYNNAQLEK